MIKDANRRGATMVEYALALAILAFAFIAASRFLTVSSSRRYDRAVNPVRNMAPCGNLGTSAGLGGSECL